MKTFILADGKYQIDRNEFGLITQMRRHGEVDINQPLQFSKIFHSALDHIEELETKQTNSHNRIYDCLLNDDGQAFKEAERYLKANDPKLFAKFEEAEKNVTFSPQVKPVDTNDLARATAALNTLTRLGYTWNGGAEFRPPFENNKPEWINEGYSSREEYDLVNCDLFFTGAKDTKLSDIFLAGVKHGRENP